MVDCQATDMAKSQIVSKMTERQQLVSGIIALVLATICMLALPVIQTKGIVGGGLLGLLSVSFFAFGTLSIGTSERIQV